MYALYIPPFGLLTEEVTLLDTRDSRHNNTFNHVVFLPVVGIHLEHSLDRLLHRRVPVLRGRSLCCPIKGPGRIMPVTTGSIVRSGIGRQA